MKKFLLKTRFLTFVFLFANLFFASVVFGQTVTLDQADLDYAPGETVGITGTGWQPFEVIDLQVHHLSEPIPDHGTPNPHIPWTITADDSGNFSASWFVTEFELGAQLMLFANGVQSGFTYEVFFTDGNFSFNANGLPSSQSITVNYSWPNPSGGSGTKSFNTPNTSATDGVANKNVTFTFSPTPTTISGIKYQILNYTYAVGTAPTISTNISSTFNSGAGNAANSRVISGNYGALVASSSSGTYGGTVSLTSTFYSNYQTSTGISGKTITFYIDGLSVGSAITNSSGVALLSNVSLGARNVNSYTISSSFAGDSDYLGISNGNSTVATLTIGKATSTTVVTVSGAPFIYTGSAQTPATVSVTGAGGLSLAPTSDYSNNTNAGTATASYTFAGDDNHTGSSDSEDFTIGKAILTITADNKSKYCGQADPPFTVSITGFVNNETTAVLTTLPTVNVANVTTLIPSGGTSNNYTFNYINGTLTIQNITIDASASNAPVALGAIATLSATITPNTAGISVSFYLDGLLKGTETTNASGTATLEITGLLTEVYQVKAIAGNGCADSSAYLAIYDPNGGFVTGGGWIMSPVGAYALNDYTKTLIGKANFGFVAKYKKGSTQVEGNTEFQFNAGDLNFKSTSHTGMSLVIAGAQAIYKGQGTINGIPGYSFMVSAIDGGKKGIGVIDKFRIKIWNTAGVVYDNQMGIADNAEASTAIGGGSIVIHEVKKGTIAKEVTVKKAAVIEPVSFSITAYPNPSNSYFTLELLGGSIEKTSVIVYDMLGRTVKNINSSNVQQIKFGEELPAGVYIATISQGTKQKTVKLIKQ